MRADTGDRGRLVARGTPGRKGGLARTEVEAAKAAAPGRLVLSSKDAAAAIRARGLPMAVSTLARLRTTGGGPRYIRLNQRSVVYPEDQLIAWIDGKIAGPVVASTAEEPGLPKVRK